MSIRNRYLHAHPMLDDFLEELAESRMTSKAAIYREALMDFARKVDPERAVKIGAAWREDRRKARKIQSQNSVRRVTA